MPELPEVETVKRQLQQSLKGRRIKDVFVYMDKMIKVGPGKISNIKSGSKKFSAAFAGSLKNKTVLGIDRRAKYLIVKLSGGLNLLIHLRMSGQLIYIPKKDLDNPLALSLAKSAIKQTLPSKHTHVEFLLSNGDKLFYNDTRQFGHIRLVNDAEMQKVFEQHQLGPEPLTLKPKEFTEIIGKHANKRAKDFLLNQSVIAGIGNIYADESLFIAKVNPLRKIGTLKPKQQAILLGAIQKVLKKAIALGGSSVEYFLMTNGASGSFSSEHLVYAKAGKSCPVCGRPLKSQKLAAGLRSFAHIARNKYYECMINDEKWAQLIEMAKSDFENVSYYTEDMLVEVRDNQFKDGTQDILEFTNPKGTVLRLCARTACNMGRKSDSLRKCMANGKSLTLRI
jgi:formamidopyrimidine-DNA glycosylase